MKLPVPPLALAVNVTAVPVQVVTAEPLAILTAVVGVTVNVLGLDAIVHAPELTVTV